MDRRSIRSLSSLCLVVACAGCRSYEPRPLEPRAVVLAVDRARRDPDGAEVSRATKDRSGADATGLTLGRAAAWMLDHGPDVAVAVAAYRTALARARIETPLPNPGLDVGPEFGFGDDVSVNRVVPFGSLGITIPLGARLRDADSLNRAHAEAIRVDGVARHRELYLELRRRFVALAVAREVQRTRGELAKGAAKSAATARRLVEAGQATALDVALFELERGRAEAGLLEARMAADRARAALAALIGVHADLVGNVTIDVLPAIPEQLPPLGELRDQLIDDHTGLARLRARYEEAEAALRLEVSRQYPDLRIGPSVAGETGDRKTVTGLTLGIELPVFDRNQQAIAEAEQAREEARSRFEAEANRALAELDRAVTAVRLAHDRRRALEETVLPQARRSIELGRRALAAGSADALRLLDAERSYRGVLVEVLDAVLAERDAWVDLEIAVGRPLVEFPDEAPADSPAGLRPPLEIPREGANG